MELKPWPKGKKKAAAAKAVAQEYTTIQPPANPPVVAAMPPPNPVRPSKPTPETHPHLFDEFANPK